VAKQQKCTVSKGTNRNVPARNTLVQLLAVYTDPESHNAQRYRQTDGQTDNMMMPIADHTGVGSPKTSCDRLFTAIAGFFVFLVY